MSVSLNTEWVWFTAVIFPTSVWCLLYKTQLLVQKHLITLPMLTSRVMIATCVSSLLHHRLPVWPQGDPLVSLHCFPLCKTVTRRTLTSSLELLGSLGCEHTWEYCVRGMSENLWHSLLASPPRHHVPEHWGIVKQMLLFLWQRWLLISLSFCVRVFLLKKMV